MRVVFDIETDGLNATKIWVCILKDIDTGKVHYFYDEQDFKEFAPQVKQWIGHNVIGFDIPVIERLWKFNYDKRSVVDTLVLSRLHKAKRNHGHSLDAWGKYLGHRKLDFQDFSAYSTEMEKYCLNDVELNEKVYHFLMKWFKDPEWQPSIDMEHDIAWICNDMTENGFPFDITGASKMRDELQVRVDELIDIMQQEFPPKEVHTQLKTKVRIDVYPFNPGSPKQVVERLNEIGWKPEERTKGHQLFLREVQYQRSPLTKEQLAKKDKYATYGWKVNEKNLATLPDDAPESVNFLVEYLLLSSRLRTLTEWINNYNPETGCIHGNFSGIGSWTHRMAHSAPNMGNIPAGKDDRFTNERLKSLAVSCGKRMRSFWRVETPEEEWLVGTDAEGVQLRILAHYIDDTEFTDALHKGTKEDGTDPHSLNARRLGPVCHSRNNAKTFIYAFVLGASTGKVAEIFTCSVAAAKKAVDNYVASMPGLKVLKEGAIPRDASRGYFTGFDGRKVACDNEHLMLAGYLQNGEKIIMALANRIWRKKLNDGHVSNWKQVNFVHDEWQTVVKGTREDAEYVARIQRDSIRIAGLLLGLRCPLAGSSDIGKNWYDTH